MSQILKSVLREMLRKKQLVLLFVVVVCLVAVYMLISQTPDVISLKRSQGELVHVLNDRPAVTGNWGTSGTSSQDDHIVSVAKRVGSHNGTVLVTMVNDAYLSFTYSWLCNTKNMNIHKSVLIITTDEASKAKLERDWPEVGVVAMDVGSINGDQVYSHVGYVKIMIKRTEMILAIVEAGLEVFLFEVDCLWFGNPLPGLQAMKGYDVLVNPVAQRSGIYAGGFLYLFVTDKAKGLWKALTEKMLALGNRIAQMDDKKAISEGDNDQNYFSSLIVSKYGGISYKELPLDIYADGKWYELSEDQRKTSKAIIVNNNWVLGNPAKIERAKKWSHWFTLDDMTCDMDLVNKIVHKPAV